MKLSLATGPVARFAALPAALVALLLLASCSGGDIASFKWRSASGENLPFAQTGGFPEGKENGFSGARPKNSYTLRKPLEAGRGSMVAVSVSSRREGLVIGLSLSSDPKKPGRERLFAAKEGRTRFYLSLPETRTVKSLALRLVREGSGLDPKDETVLAELEAVSVLPAFRGYERIRKDEYRISDGISIERQNPGSSLWSLERPFAGFGREEREAGSSPGLPALTIRYAAPVDASIVVDAGRKIAARSASAGRKIVIPADVFPGAGLQASMTIAVPDAVELEAAYIEILPADQASAVDPGILLLRPSLPEGEDFAWYRWDLLPDVLMFDFRTYAVQDAYLKRLAFFVEKKGFAGRLARDSEIASLHGWNAHDYKMDDVARFFTDAVKADFPLRAEELRLRDFLVEKGLLDKRGREYSGGKGAIISISQESEPYLRHTFLTHESSHALFFADGAYRDFCVSMWNGMTKEEKWFWLLYFGWMNYNTSSSYLMANEMQAYLIQQLPRKAGEYFTKTLVERLLENHPELKEPLTIYMETFGAEFERKAAILDGWLKKAYGFGAGTTFFLR